MASDILVIGGGAAGMMAAITAARAGKSVILLSSDLPEVVGLCDRAVILREGHIIGEIPKEAINENSLLIAANGEGEYVTCPKK